MKSNIIHNKKYEFLVILVLIMSSKLDDLVLRSELHDKGPVGEFPMHAPMSKQHCCQSSIPIQCLNLIFDPPAITQ